MTYRGKRLGHDDQSDEVDPQRASELTEGLMDALEELRSSLEGPQLVLLDSILSALMPEGSYDALTGVTGVTARPTAPTTDAPYAIDTSARRLLMAHGASRRRRVEQTLAADAAFVTRWPDAARVRRRIW